jgi:hypothetical protein
MTNQEKIDKAKSLADLQYIIGSNESYDAIMQVVELAQRAVDFDKQFGGWKMDEIFEITRDACCYKALQWAVEIRNNHSCLGCPRYKYEAMGCNGFICDDPLRYIDIWFELYMNRNKE